MKISKSALKENKARGDIGAVVIGCDTSWHVWSFKTDMQRVVLEARAKKDIEDHDTSDPSTKGYFRYEVITY